MAGADGGCGRIAGMTESESTNKRVVVVSGLPRSGTSLMMAMLARGGIAPLTDELRNADEDNPRGYYEFEPVKQLRNGTTDWLPRAQGKAVKVIAFLLEFLPPGYAYDVVLMRRALPEVIASQREMLIRRGEDPEKVSAAEMAEIFERHLASVKTWLNEQRHMRVIEVDYNRLLENPQPEVTRLALFLEGRVDAAAMLAGIDRSLYRQRQG